jgi:hypothetical protein
LGVGVGHLPLGGGGQVSGNSVLGLHCGVHEFLRSLLELLLCGLGVRVGGPSLVLYLYVDWLPVGTNLLSLLGLRGLIATIHRVVHHSSVERIVVCWLVLSP